MQPRYSHQITIPADAIDMFGHANNVEYIRWVIDVAVAHSAHVGLTWDDYRALGAGFIIRRHSIEYLRGAREGEVLTLTTWLASTTRITADRATEITNARGELVATALTTWVFVSLETLRPVRIPQSVRVAFGESAPESPAGAASAED